MPVGDACSLRAFNHSTCLRDCGFFLTQSLPTLPGGLTSRAPQEGLNKRTPNTCMTGSWDLYCDVPKPYGSDLTTPSNIMVPLISGVSNCYVFKSRLQEYAQKAGIPTPVYETVKEGPSHEPVFRSTVIVNNVRYDSLPGFYNRKAAEQSAAEVALSELLKSGSMAECIPQPVEEKPLFLTALFHSMKQEYAQKMNYAIPSYICNKQALPGKLPYSCTVEIGGIQYIGAAAKTKKEAEIKAARTALLAIQSNTCNRFANPDGGPTYTVVPCKKKGRESADTQTETPKPLKAKKGDFKKKWKRRFPRKRGDVSKTNQNEQENADKENGSMATVEDSLMSEMNNRSCNVENHESEFDQNAQGISHADNAHDIEVKDSGSTAEISEYSGNGILNANSVGQHGSRANDTGDMAGAQAICSDMIVAETTDPPSFISATILNNITQDVLPQVQSNEGLTKEDGQRQAQVYQDGNAPMQVDASQPTSAPAASSHGQVGLVRQDAGNGIWRLDDNHRC
ncbi:hypothetical protein ACLOJK_036221 [Asimina triloba]